MSTQPTLSIIIPTHNRSSRLSKTISSAIAQVSSSDEIIVIDDGSTDNTQQTLKKFNFQHSNFHLITHRLNLGVHAARNSGIFAATKNWVCYLDSDDHYLPGAIKTIKQNLLQYGHLYPIVQFMLQSSRGRLLGYRPPGRWQTHTPTLEEIVVKKHFVADMHRCVKTQIAQQYPWQLSNPGNLTFRSLFLHRRHLPSIYINRPVVYVDESSPRRRSQIRHARWPQHHIYLYRHFLSQYQPVFNHYPAKKSHLEMLIGKCYLHLHEPIGIYWILKSFISYPSKLLSIFKLKS